MRRTPQQWLTLFKIQNKSHLSVKQFCLEQGISTSNFYKNKAVASATSIAPTVMTSPFSQVHLAMPGVFQPSCRRMFDNALGGVGMLWMQADSSQIANSGAARMFYSAGPTNPGSTNGRMNSTMLVRQFYPSAPGKVPEPE